MNGDKLLKTPHYITSPFGLRENPVTKKSEGHNGTDYGTNHISVPCYGVENGKVLRVGKDRYGARFVYVLFPRLNKVGLYYHVEPYVKTGQSVDSTTKVGMVVKSGQSTGIHLHFSWIEYNENSMKYYGANYINFETYVFPEEKKEDVEMVENVKMKINGTIKEVSSIVKDGKNYVELRDLTDVINVSYDAANKLPIITKK